MVRFYVLYVKKIQIYTVKPKLITRHKEHLRTLRHLWYPGTTYSWYPGTTKRAIIWYFKIYT